MGVFEEAETELGTKILWDALGDTAAYTVIGGGDSITATTKYGKTAQISYICTGGGALDPFPVRGGAAGGEGPAPRSKGVPMKIDFGFGTASSVEVPDKTCWRSSPQHPETGADRGGGGAPGAKNPIASRPLGEIVKPGEKIVVISSDITRPMPTHLRDAGPAG